MEVEVMLTFLTYTAFCLYFLRALVNWGLLNKLEKTQHPKVFNPQAADLIATFRHLTISFLRPRWQGGDYGTLKAISNTFSLMLYLTLFLLLIGVLLL